MIRSATAGDAPVISKLADQLGYRASPEQVRERLLEATCVVAEQGGQVIGWMQLERRALVTTGPIAEVIALVVDADGRGRGVGVALLEWAESWAASGGLIEVRIRCNAVRVETHAFYERRGYRDIKAQKVFIKTLSSR